MRPESRTPAKKSGRSPPEVGPQAQCIEGERVRAFQSIFADCRRKFDSLDSEQAASREVIMSSKLKSVNAFCSTRFTPQTL